MFLQVMAVRLSKKARLPPKIASSVVNTNEITKTTLDHVERILTDHDYLKHPNLDEQNNEKTSVVMEEAKEPHVGPMTVQSDMQDQSEACLVDIRKVEKSEVAANEGGIEASDLAGLLDKFEEAIGNSASILTPATSPGHFESWSEPLSVKIDSHEDATDLTPPTTPPIQEQPEQKHIHNNCKHVTKKASHKLEEKTNTLNKEKAEKVKYTVEQKKPGTVVLKKVGIAEHSKAKGKRKFNDPTPGAIVEKKAKILVENKKEMDVKFSGESSKNIVESFAENSTNNESLISIKNDSVVGDAMKEKSSKVSKGESVAVPKSNASELSEKLPTVNCIKDTKTEQQNSDAIQESSKDENCSKSRDMTEETLPKLDNDHEDNQQNKVNNNNNEIELRVNTCKNNDKRQVEHSQKKKHLNDSHGDDDHKSKNGDKDETSKRTKRVKEVSRVTKRRRRDWSRSPTTDEDSSDEERTNPRKSERYHESERHSHHSKRRKEKHRKSSSRDEYDEERRHRRYNDLYQRKPWKYVRNIEHERKIDFRLGRSSIRDVAKGERRVVYVGGLPYGTTRDELWNRFRKFGPIEEITVHLRVGERDNYGFVTFLEPEDARVCIEEGNADPTEPQFDLCFGGRRQFCGGSYVDFDSTTSYIEELSETYGKVCDDIPEEDDFDSLLRMCQEGLGR